MKKENTNRSLALQWFRDKKVEEQNRLAKHYYGSIKIWPDEIEVIYLKEKENPSTAIVDSGGLEDATKWNRGSNYGGACMIREGVEDICQVFDAEKNADLICEAVNNYQKLKDINKELLDVAESCLTTLEALVQDDTIRGMRWVLGMAIQKAKQTI